MRQTVVSLARQDPWDRSPTTNVLTHSEAAIGPHALTVRSTTTIGGAQRASFIHVTQWIHRVTGAGTLGRARIAVGWNSGDVFSLMHFNNTVDATVELDWGGFIPIAASGQTLTASTEDLGAGGTIDYRGSFGYLSFAN